MSYSHEYCTKDDTIDENCGILAIIRAKLLRSHRDWNHPRLRCACQILMLNNQSQIVFHLYSFFVFFLHFAWVSLCNETHRTKADRVFEYENTSRPSEYTMQVVVFPWTQYEWRYKPERNTENNAGNISLFLLYNNLQVCIRPNSRSKYGVYKVSGVRHSFMI